MSRKPKAKPVADVTENRPDPVAPTEMEPAPIPKLAPESKLAPTYDEYWSNHQ